MSFLFYFFSSSRHPSVPFSILSPLLLGGFLLLLDMEDITQGWSSLCLLDREGDDMKL